MPWFRMRDGSWCHLHFGSRNRLPENRPCAVCHYFSSRLCDWKLPDGRTCDLPLCDWHAFQPVPGKDICPLHEGAAKAWLAARTNSIDGAGP